ncbi:MAG: hypothetical protein B6U97_05080 [Candidatus Altiarchaeales archaeon ex4484_96]|nr:MAG: hypothetical protein B6U97_05080 [Candidatus Altiarchaeales archaeon ex4484_96]
MADLKSIELEGDDTYVTLKVSNSEYELVRMSKNDLAILPTDNTILDEILTTGKIGNGNRIMMPNGILNKHDITRLYKKVPSRIFHINKSKYLLIKLEECEGAIPRFEE